MFVAIIDSAGLMHFVAPAAIRSLSPSGAGARVETVDGRAFDSPCDIVAIRRRVRSLAAFDRQATRALRRLWLADLWRRARGLAHVPLRRVT